jgi:hypothetical protein
VSDWEARAARAAQRYEDGAGRLPDDLDERQRQLTRMGNAAWAAGLSLLMLGRGGESSRWLARSAERYRESWADAPPESWGRPIGAMKARLLAGDSDGARAEAGWALEAGAARSESPIARYAATLALLVRGEDEPARAVAAGLRELSDFPQPVARAVARLSEGDAAGYEAAVRELLADFEARDDYLEDVPVADTVLVLQTLAERRGFAADLQSPLLPT